jgi:acyl transferase domain-containing protein
MRHAGEKLELALAPYITHNETMLPLYSTVTGTVLSNPAHLDATYWRRNLESPVIFNTAIQSLFDHQKDRAKLFVEIGPDSTLAAPLRQIVSLQSVQSYYIPTLLKNADQTHCLLKAVGEIHSHGGLVNFAALYPLGTVLADLPVYPWDRTSIDWRESRVSHNWRFRKHPHHELLGSRMLEASDIEPAWRNLLSPRNVTWLRDHQVLGEMVFPCAGYLAMVNEAMRQLFNTQECTVRNLHMKIPLVLPMSEIDNVEIVTSLRPTRINDQLDSKWYEFSISSYDGSEWIKHTVGKVISGVEVMATAAPAPQRFSRLVSSAFWYRTLAKVGLQYGPHFQGLEDITADPLSFRATATLHGRSVVSESSHALHPTAIDQCLQLFSVAACKGKAIHMTELYIPVFIDEVCLGENRDSMKVQVTSNSFTGNQGQGDVLLMAEGNTVLSMSGVTLARLDQRKENESSGIPLLSEVEWKPDLDLLPRRLQLPTPKSREDIIGLLARASALSMILVYRKIADVKPCSELFQSYKTWLQKQIQEMQNRGMSAIPEVQGWSQMDSGSLQLQQQTIDQQLKARNLEFISELSQMVVEDKIFACEGVSDSSFAPEKNEKLERLDDWISSLSDLSEWFSLLRHSTPNLRILEVGGGRGSFSSSVLKYLTDNELTHCSQYTWTEMLHIDDAVRDRLQDYKQVEFKQFNINLDPSQQGLSEGAYDLVIASNVGHIQLPGHLVIADSHKARYWGGRSGNCPEKYRKNFEPGWTTSTS